MRAATESEVAEVSALMRGHLARGQMLRDITCECGFRIMAIVPPLISGHAPPRGSVRSREARAVADEAVAHRLAVHGDL